MTKWGRGWRGCLDPAGSRPAFGQRSYLERGHGRVPAIPVYGVELGRVVELMVQLRMSFASVHHFLEGKRRKGQQKWTQQKQKEKKRRRANVGAGRLMAEMLRDTARREGRRQIDPSLAHAHTSSTSVLWEFGNWEPCGRSHLRGNPLFRDGACWLAVPSPQYLIELIKCRTCDIWLKRPSLNVCLVYIQIFNFLTAAFACKCHGCCLSVLMGSAGAAQRWIIIKSACEVESDAGARCQHSQRRRRSQDWRSLPAPITSEWALSSLLLCLYFALSHLL